MLRANFARCNTSSTTSCHEGSPTRLKTWLPTTDENFNFLTIVNHCLSLTLLNKTQKSFNINSVPYATNKVKKYEQSLVSH